MADEKKYVEVSQEDGVPTKPFGYGVRHIQMLCMTALMISLFISRSSMGVAVLAMTDIKRINDTNVKIYNWDKNTQGIILSSFFWGYMAMQIPAGILAKRFGGKPILLVALLASGLVCLLIPLLVDFGGWRLVCACRVIMGLTQACLFSASHTLLGKWLPASERTNYMGLVYGGSQLGIIIAMPMSGLLAETALGWKMIFYTVAGLSMLTAVIWCLFSASSPGEHRMMTEEEKAYIERGLNLGSQVGKHPRTPWKHIMTSSGMWALIIAHMGSMLIFILMFVDMPTFLERGMGISLKNSAVLSALPYVGMWAGNVISSWLSQQMYTRKIMTLGALRKLFNSISCFGVSAGLVVLSLLSADYSQWAVVTLVVSLFLQGFFNAGFIINYLDISPNYGGVMMSITNFVANMGSVVTPVFTSYILNNDPTDLSRWRIVFLLSAAISTVSNCGYLILASSKIAPWDDPDYDEKKINLEEIKPVLQNNKEEEAKKSRKSL